MNETLSPKTCENCGESIPIPPYAMSVAQWERKRACSRACWGRICSKERQASTRVCNACGTDFIPKHFGAKYCSSECAKDRFTGKQGANHYAWKGGRTEHGDGYIRVHVPRDHPMADTLPLTANRYILEHRLVMAEHLGRPLSKKETIHHINGDRADNRIENLQLRSGRHGKGHTLRCRSCGSTDIEHSEI